MILSAVDPAVIKFVLERPDGSGVVELPILCETESIDLSRTATGANRKETISHDDLVQAVANFAHWPGPVPVHRYPHRSVDEAAGPGDGFMEQLEVRGTQLWARMDLTAELFSEVKGRKWRGFSVDCGRGTVRPTKKFSGFVVARGVFTNQPATDVNFKVAASAEVDVDLTPVFTPIEASASDAGRGKKMAKDDEGDVEVRLATAKADLTVKTQKIESLETKLAISEGEVVAKERDRATMATKLADAQTELQTAKLSVDGLKHQNGEKDERIAQLTAERDEAKAKLAQVQAETTGTKVLRLCREAIEKGVAPAMIEAFGDYQKNPVAMLNTRFGGSIDSLELVLSSLPKDAALAAVNSGRQKPAGDGDSGVPADIAAELSRRGIDPKYATIDNTDQLAALSAKK
jgi:hypothetical protein